MWRKALPGVAAHGAKGQSRIGAGFTGCYLETKLVAQSGQVRRIERALHQRFRGAIQNDDNGCNNIAAGNGHVEGREIRHSRLIARHRFRMV